MAEQLTPQQEQAVKNRNGKLSLTNAAKIAELLDVTIEELI